jgi:hypothetical protein
MEAERQSPMGVTVNVSTFAVTTGGLLVAPHETAPGSFMYLLPSHVLASRRIVEGTALSVVNFDLRTKSSARGT